MMVQSSTCTAAHAGCMFFMWVSSELYQSVCLRDLMTFFPVSGGGGDGEEVDGLTFVTEHD